MGGAKGTAVRAHTQDLQEDYLCTFAKIEMRSSSSPPSSFMEMCVFPSNVVFFQQTKGGLRWKCVPCSVGQGWDAGDAESFRNLLPCEGSLVHPAECRCGSLPVLMRSPAPGFVLMRLGLCGENDR